MGRPRAFSIEAALDAAIEVFGEKEFAAASISDLTGAMGINSPSLYAAYGNKEELFRKAIAKFTEGNNAHISACLETGTAREGVDRLLRDGVRMFTNRAISRTCFVTLAPLKPSEASEETRQDIAEKRAAIEQIMRRRFDRAIAAGESARLPWLPAQGQKRASLVSANGGSRFRLRSSSYGGQVANPTLRARETS